MRVATLRISLFFSWVRREAIKTCEIYTQIWAESKSPIASEPTWHQTRNPNQNISLFLERCGFYFSSFCSLFLENCEREWTLESDGRNKTWDKWHRTKHRAGAETNPGCDRNSGLSSMQLNEENFSWPNVWIWNDIQWMNIDSLIFPNSTISGQQMLRLVPEIFPTS